jgi:adenylate cyclase
MVAAGLPRYNRRASGDGRSNWNRRPAIRSVTLLLRNFLLRHRGVARAALGVVIGSAVGLAITGLTAAGALDRFEWVVYDALARATAGHRGLDNSRADRGIVVLAVDEGTLQQFGRGDRGINWPWPRGMYGLIVEFCRQAGARAVVFDILMAGRSRDDQTEPMFVEAMKSAAAGRMPVILAASFSNFEEIDKVATDSLARSAVPIDVAPGAAARIAELPGAIAPPKDYLDSVGGVGDTAATPEGDGVVRRVRHLVRYKDRVYPSLALATAWRLAGRPPLKLDAAGLWLGDTRVPVDADGMTAVRYNGPPQRAADPKAGTYENLRAFNLMEYQLRVADGATGPFNDLPTKPAEFQDKIVLVGTTAGGLLDLKASPFSDVHPGVEIHANALDNLLHGRFIDRRWAVDGAFTGVCVALAVAAGLLGTFLPAAAGLPLCLAGLGGVAAFGWYGLAHADTAWRLLPPAGGVAVAYLVGLAGGFTLERSQKAWVQGAFSQFLSRDVLDQLMRHPERLALGGERKAVTVFFSDVAGFTALSEQVTPEQLVQYLNRYLTRMSDVLVRRGAYIDKFIGDAIMAFWGAPNPDENHARHACLAALDCIAEMEAIAAEFAGEGFPPLACRIGLNTGPVICGMMGSEQKLNYTVMGDTVNTASRLEGANKPFGSRILVSEEVLAAAGDGLEAREVDLVRVKGRRQPVRLFELVGRAGQLTERTAACLKEFRRGLELYKQGKWAPARECFAQAAVYDYADLSPSSVYAERCGRFVEHPPPADWDGVYEMKTK